MEANLDNPGFSGLATDLYQLTMAAAYHANGRDERASFELFTRKLPEGRSYLIVAGLEQASAQPPDLVLCDLGLPGLDGFEIAKRLRAVGVRSRLVALTGYASPEDAERARQAGFDHHLAKPPDMEKLAAILAATRRRGS